MAALEPSRVGLCLRHRSFSFSATLAARVVLPGCMSAYVAPLAALDVWEMVPEPGMPLTATNHLLLAGSSSYFSHVLFTNRSTCSSILLMFPKGRYREKLWCRKGC